MTTSPPSLLSSLDVSAPDTPVLLAEDDPVFRHLVKTWLTRWSYSVTAVDNGTSAWELLHHGNADPILIFDGMMPGLDGIELCRKVRAQVSPQYRYIILLTANDDKRDIVAGLDAGADDYLTKPFHAEELRARIRAGHRIVNLQAALLKARDTLQFQAEHDELTALLNRGAIMGVLFKEMKRYERVGGSLGVLMIDIDHFKKVNDTHGHLIGDVVLREVSSRLVSALRVYDSVGRFGGEEFLAILPGCSPAALAAGAERLRSAIASAPVVSSDKSISVTISIGAASANSLQTSLPEELLRAADSRLYIAKANGRNRVQLTD